MKDNTAVKYYGTWGWAEFDSNRVNILNEYEIAKIKNSSREVKTSHGNTFESSIIDWLNKYLPSKYAATSGYIAPNNYDLNCIIKHYDLIIYLRNESPVLWIESDRDITKPRAIPAEFVVSVFEIKSTFTHTNINKAIDKLHELDSYKEDLHQNFFTGIIFAELLEKDSHKIKMIYDLFEAHSLLNFWCGIILKNNIEEDIPCLFSFLPSQQDNELNTDTLVKEIKSLDIYLTPTNSLKMVGLGAGASLTKISKTKWAVNKEYQVLYARNGISINYIWSREKFLVFSIELLNKLNGKDQTTTTKPRYGRVFDALEIKDA